MRKPFILLMACAFFYCTGCIENSAVVVVTNDSTDVHSVTLSGHGSRYLTVNETYEWEVTWEDELTDMSVGHDFTVYVDGIFCEVIDVWDGDTVTFTTDWCLTYGPY